MRVSDLDALGLQSVPVTTVFTGAVLSGGTPFWEIPGFALVNSFFKNATDTYGHRFVFTFNFYPYFDPNFPMDVNSSDKCESSLAKAQSFENNGYGPSVPMMTKLAREAVQQLTGSNDYLVWIGETGWSSPSADSLGTSMKNCQLWSSDAALRSYYEGFLQWDLEEGGDPSVPDHAFYFTARDSDNFGIEEHFGLLASCHEHRCKIRSPGFRSTLNHDFSGTPLPILSELWLKTAGCFAAAALLSLSINIASMRRRASAGAAASTKGQHLDFITPAVMTSAACRLSSQASSPPEHSWGCLCCSSASSSGANSSDEVESSSSGNRSFGSSPTARIYADDDLGEHQLV
mmetsp:Transcript_4434/g.10612  ORF Transcript_4434/g.10612 Transcript_4434/m.10612 type:complete len:346 (-) Transcript_4434:276-1313(-)